MVSTEELKKKCGIGDPKKCNWIARNFGVKFVLPFTRPLLWGGFQAEEVCLLWIIIGSIAGILYCFGNYWLGIAALLFYHISYILDGVDGAVARYRNKCTFRGVYLDLVGHTIVKTFLVLGMGIGSYVMNPTYLPIPRVSYLIAGGIAAVFMINNNIARLKTYETLVDIGKTKELKKKRTLFKPGKGKIDVKQSILEFLSLNPLSLFYFATVFNFIPLMILFYALALPVMFFIRVYQEYSWVEKHLDNKK